MCPGMGLLVRRSGLRGLPLEGGSGAEPGGSLYKFPPQGDALLQGGGIIKRAGQLAQLWVERRERAETALVARLPSVGRPECQLDRESDRLAQERGSLSRLCSIHRRVQPVFERGDRVVAALVEKGLARRRRRFDRCGGP